MLSSFDKPKEILRHIQQNGYDAYIVGGAVRDYFLQKPIHDIDITTSATPIEIQNIFPVTIPVGIEHGTVIVRYDNESYEITTFRTESTYVDYRHPSEVTFVKSLEEDLKRRDFTMNAMALSYNGTFIDPFNGQADLLNQMLRTVGNPYERFSEDPLRMVRAFRFVSQLNLSMDPDVQHAISSLASLIKNISMERILAEFDKLLMGLSVNRAIMSMVSTGFIEHIPYFSGKAAEIKRVIALPISNLQSVEERWCLLLLILDLTNDGVFFRDWHFSKRRQKTVKQLLNICTIMSNQQWDPQLLYRFGLEDALAATRVLAVVGDVHKLDDINQLITMYQTLPIKNRLDLVITGHDIITWVRQEPGPWVNTLLEWIERQVINKQIKNDKDDIRRWVSEWLHFNKNC